jgi:hypothetical protein
MGRSEDAACRPAAVGCFRKPDLISTQTNGVRHELVHFVMYDLAGASRRWLEEGTAVVFDQYFRPFGNFPFEPTELNTFAEVNDNNEQESYYLEGSLAVGYILKRFPPEVALDFYQSVPRDATSVEVDGIMQEVLGVSMGELDRDWRMDGVCTHSPLPCIDDALPVHEIPFRLERAIDCDDPETLGYGGDSFAPYVPFQFRVPKDGLYRISYVARRRAYHYIWKCAPVCADSPRSYDFFLTGRGADTGEGPPTVLAGDYELPAGLYRGILSSYDPSLPAICQIEDVVDE